MLGRLESQQLPERLKRIAGDNWLNVTLSVSGPAAEGLHHSGMFIINPPWTLHTTLKETMPWLVQALAVDSGAHFALQVAGETGASAKVASAPMARGRTR